MCALVRNDKTGVKVKVPAHIKTRPLTDRKDTPYHGAVPALEDIRRCMNYSVYRDGETDSISVRTAMENSFGKAAVRYFEELYKEANTGAVRDRMEEASRKMLSAFRKNAVAYSASVLIQQPSSIYRAMAMVDAKYFGRHGLFTLASGIGKAVTWKWNPTWDNAYAEMKKYAPGVTMAKEVGGFDTGSGGTIRSYLVDTEKTLRQNMETGTAKEKADAVLGVVDDNWIANLPNVADKIAWVEIWEACKRETVAKHKTLRPGSDAFLQKVGERFTEVIRATQVYDSMFAKSPMMRSNRLAVQGFMSFMNEPNTIANMAESAVRQATRGNWKQFARTTASLALSIVVNDVLKSLVYAARDDDEDESALEKYASALVSSLISDVTALNYIPYVKDVWSLLEGYDAERADMSVISDAINALRNVIKTGKDGDTLMSEKEWLEWDKERDEAYWKLAESLAPFLRVPLKNIRRDVAAIVNAAHVIKGGEKTTQTGLRYATKEGITGEKLSDKEQLYRAKITGDKEHEARVAARYEDEKAVQSAMRDVIKGHYLARDIDTATAQKYLVKYAGKDGSEAYWLTEEWDYNATHDDDYGKYDKLYTAVQTGKNLKNVIKDYVDHGVEAKTLRSQITEEFKPLYVEMSAVERAAIKGYLLNAFEQCGMVRLDAEEKLADWDFEAKHGFDYTNRGEAYRNREITREQLMDAMQTYGGMTAEEAARYIDEQDFHVATGYAYSDKAKAYKEGYLDADILHMALMNIDGLSEEDADVKMRAYNWMKQNPSYELDVNEALA